jgi:hypothetical protein
LFTLYNVTVVVAAAATFLIALKSTRLPTQPWYYVPLLAVLAPALDAAARLVATSATAGTATASGWRRVVRLALALVIASAVTLPAWRLLHERRTNVDLVAATLAKRVAPGEAIVVYPWYCGVSFRRYYEGKAPWVAVPPLEDLRIHRYDLLKAAMAQPNPMEPAVELMGKTLQSGHRVWVVGGLPTTRTDVPPPILPPAPHGPQGWNNGPYVTVWGMQTAYFLQTHALHAEFLPAPSDARMNPFENLSVVVVSGWR